MKTRFSLLLLGLFLSITPSWAITANEFMAQLQSKSPTFDGAPLRSYRVEDLNQDKQSEVLEVVNPVEVESTGLLNAELSPVFEWIDVYRKENERFVKATDQFPELLKDRRKFYSDWLQRFNKPESLQTDSQHLLEANSAKFKMILNEYVAKIDRSLLSGRPNKSLKPTNPAQGD